jgi:hypothetical protein
LLLLKKLDSACPIRLENEQDYQKKGSKPLIHTTVFQIPMMSTLSGTAFSRYVRFSKNVGAKRGDFEYLNVANETLGS